MIFVVEGGEENVKVVEVEAEIDDDLWTIIIVAGGVLGVIILCIICFVFR